MKTFFVIAGKVKSSGEVKYIYNTEFGYSWTTSLQCVKFFNSIEECEKVIQSKEFTKTVKMSDGVIYPSYILQNLSGCNYQKMQETVEVSIQKICFDNLMTKEFFCEIKKPKETIYVY